MNLQFCPNLSVLFTEVPFLDRFEQAARAGFGAVEFLFPYKHGVDRVKSRLEALELTAVLLDVPPGDLEAGEIGTLCRPVRRDYFRRSFETALDAADRLSCDLINVLFGNKDADLDPDAQVDCAVENLLWAAPQAADAGVMLLLEALNAIDHPQYFLNTASDALDVVKTVDHPWVKLQYDVYHAQMTHGNLISSISDCIGYVEHVQISDVPGRHEPGTGEINFPVIFAQLAKLNYRGYIGLEYRPLQATLDSLEWLPLESRRFAFP